MQIFAYATGHVISRADGQMMLRLAGAISTCKHSRSQSIFRTNSIIMDKSIRKIQKFSERHPSIISSEDEVEELMRKVNLNASTTEMNSTKTNIILSIPSQFPEETFPAVNLAHTIMSIVPRNCKVVSKSRALPELFNLRFIESQYSSDPQLEAIYQLIKSKDPEAMNRY